MGLIEKTEFIYIYGFSIIEYRLFCNERRGRMCINTKLENENWDATNSWSGYNYQGKIALFVVLKKINELISIGKVDEIEKYSIELEWLEDFSILYKDNDGVQYKTIHQVKAKDKHNITDYEDALVKLYYKIVNHKTIEYAYLHVCKSINYDENEWNDKVKELILKCSHIKALQNIIISYKSNPKKKDEVEKIYKSGRKSEVNKLIKEYNEKYFEYRKINVHNVDNILDRILSDLQAQMLTSQNIQDEDIKKLEVYSYSNGNVYCELAEINDLIKVEINSYWRNTGAEGWKCTDQNFCEMIFLCLQGLIDKHITQRHIQYNKTAERRIGFNRIRKVLDSDDSIKRCEEYYLYNIKNKLLMMCGEYHEYCLDEWDSEEERVMFCKQCEVSAFYEHISRMSEDKIRDLIHTINPNVLKKIDEMNWAEYCIIDRYKNPFFKGLRDINSTFEKDRDYISYVGKNKTLNLLTTVGNRDGSKKALMRACGEIVANPNLYEILMDVNCLISRDLETDSIYDGAGDFLKEFEIEEEHIYHCKNIKMEPLEDAIVDIDGGIEND